MKSQVAQGEDERKEELEVAPENRTMDQGDGNHDSGVKDGVVDDDRAATKNIGWVKRREGREGSQAGGSAAVAKRPPRKYGGPDIEEAMDRPDSSSFKTTAKDVKDRADIREGRERNRGSLSDIVLDVGSESSMGNSLGDVKRRAHRREKRQQRLSSQDADTAIDEAATAIAPPGDNHEVSSSRSDEKIARHSGSVIQIGAVAMSGLNSMDGSTPDDLEWENRTPAFPSEPQVVGDSTSTSHQPTVVLDGHLPDEGEGNGSEETMVIDGVRERKTADEEHARKRKKIMMIGSCIFVVVVIVAAIGSVIGARTTGASSGERDDPTRAVVSQAEQNEAIVEFLIEASTVANLTFAEGTPEAMATDWIVREDPLQIKAVGPRLVQRFALVLFYFQTTRAGTTKWTRCNPPSDDSVDACIADQGEVRWLSGASECDWFGIACNQSNEVTGVAMRE